jgi:hypothetical protein
MPSGFASMNQRPNQSLEPTACRCEVHFVFMKQSPVFATLAPASGGSAPSRSDKE